MCTLTFVPTPDGYVAGMNRDELLTRPLALPPRSMEKEGLQAVGPVEPSGGTWIGCNRLGNLLALLNWNDVEAASAYKKTRTRGLVIPELIGEVASRGIDSRWERAPLDGMLAFRLVGIFPRERKIFEWRWDTSRMDKMEHGWARRHWFSSSLSDADAAAERGQACEAAAQVADCGSASWLRALHRSHVPAPGPFSVCMHRPDAETVSYTEVECLGPAVSMGYWAGSPCRQERHGQRVRLSSGAAA